MPAADTGPGPVGQRSAVPARELLPDADLAERLQLPDPQALRREFVEQGGFVHVPDFLDPQLAARLAELAESLEPGLNRNYLPGHKQGGSVSRHTIDTQAPLIAELYRSRRLIHWLEQLCAEQLQVSPADDPHAYALYFYTRPGDHIGWHYDTSYYAGRRYTVLLGVLDRSSSLLEYRLHTRETGKAVVSGSVRIAPGGLVCFDGDKLHHRITPLGANEKRVSLTFEYVTDARMHPLWRLVSNLKDAFGYFGLRQVFGRRSSPAGGEQA